MSNNKPWHGPHRNELDTQRRGFRLDQINDVHQSNLTSTAPKMFTAEFRSHAELLKVAKGRIGG